MGVNGYHEGINRSHGLKPNEGFAILRSCVNAYVRDGSKTTAIIAEDRVEGFIKC